jgi:hypothetical protein
MTRFLPPLLLIALFISADVRAQCAQPLAPLDDGSGASGAEGLPAVVISEIKPGPGGYIELFNTTNGDFNTTGYWFCSPFVYAQVSVLVPAGSYKTVPWPASFDDTAAGGEIQLFRSSAFNTSIEILDFVCWGVNPHSSRKGQAEAVGKWSGPCPGVLTNGAIHRKIGTKGTTAADYDVSAAPSPMNCTPDPTGVPPRLPVATLASYPNPFTSATQIEVSLTAPDGVVLSVYSVDGRRIRSLGYRALPAGESRVVWDGTDDAGGRVASGIYLVQVEGRARAVARVTLVR